MNKIHGTGKTNVIAQPPCGFLIENLAVVLSDEHCRQLGVTYETRALWSLLGLMFFCSQGVRLASVQSVIPLDSMYSFLDFTLGHLDPDCRIKSQCILQVLKKVKAGVSPKSWKLAELTVGRIPFVSAAAWRDIQDMCEKDEPTEVSPTTPTHSPESPNPLVLPTHSLAEIPKAAGDKALHPPNQTLPGARHRSPDDLTLQPFVLKAADNVSPEATPQTTNKPITVCPSLAHCSPSGPPTGSTTLQSKDGKCGMI